MTTTLLFVDAFIDSLLQEISIAYWNINQENWDPLDDPKIKGIEYRPFYWGDDQEEIDKPNLKFDFSSQEIKWYKYPGRGQTSLIDFTEHEWIEWYEEAYKLISRASYEMS